MAGHRVTLEVLRWVSFSSAALTSLILVLNMSHIAPKPDELAWVILLIVVPAFVAAVLNAFNWLWPNLILGPWFIFVSAMIRADYQYDVWSLLLVLSSLLMFLTPIVSIALRRTSRQRLVSERRQSLAAPLRRHRRDH